MSRFTRIGNSGLEKCQSPVLREVQIKKAFEILLAKIGQDKPIFTAEQWKNLVENVVVYAGLKFLFCLKDATEIEVVLEQ